MAGTWKDPARSTRRARACRRLRDGSSPFGWLPPAPSRKRVGLRENERPPQPGRSHFLLSRDKNAFVGPSSSWSLLSLSLSLSCPLARSAGVSAGREELPGGAMHLLQLPRVRRADAPVETPVPRYQALGCPVGSRVRGRPLHTRRLPSGDGGEGTPWPGVGRWTVRPGGRGQVTGHREEESASLTHGAGAGPPGTVRRGIRPFRSPALGSSVRAMGGRS